MTDNELLDTNNQSSVDISSKEEKMLPQSRVDELVKVAKRNAYEKASREAEERLRSQSQSSSEGISQGVPDEGKIKQIIQEQLNAEREMQARQMHEQAANRVIDSLKNKMESAHTKYPDYNEVVSKVSWDRVPELLPFIDQFENSADMLYELGNNPAKISNLMSIGQYSSEATFRKELQKLSDSISQNEKAKSQTFPKEPLSEIKPSNIGMGNGNSLSDFKLKYRN